MALPYKLFKDITIDGTKMGLDPDLGKIVETSKTPASVGSWTFRETDPITIAENGVYLATVETDISALVSTGNCVGESAIRKNGSELDYNVFYTYGGNGLRFINTYFVKCNAGDTITGAAQSSIGSSIGLILRMVKLISMQ